VGPAVPRPLAAVDHPRPLRPVAIAAVIALGVVMVSNLVALWVDVLQLNLANDLQGGRRVPFAELTASDDRVTTSGLLQTGCYVVCIIAFLVWYGRAYFNLQRLGVRDLRFGEGMAIFYWFIPIANFFRPKQVVNDIWRGSDPDLPRGHWARGHVPAVIHFWWAAWLISGFAERIFFRRSMEDVNTPADFVSLSQTFIAWDLIDFIPAILAIVVILKITRRQEERRRRFESGELES
jgi:hypothetical protein